jgi:dienelactone hydrolase
MRNQDFREIVSVIADKCPSETAYTGGDFTQWQKVFKDKIWSLRGREISRAGLQYSFDQEEDAGGHIRKKVLIKATEFSDVSGYLLLPKDISGKTAGIIASPGHYRFGKDSIAGHPAAKEELDAKPGTDYGKSAVEAGYVVFIPDWWGWGDRSGHLDKVGQHRDRCNVIQNSASMYGFSVLYLHILEGDAIVDFLQTLDNVDGERIGIIGNSYGGRTAMWIGAYNDKIKCVVSAGAMNLFSERASKLSSCAIQYFPGILQYGDVGEIYSLIAPKPLQLQAGTDDPLITPADRDRIADTVRKAYKALNKEDNLSIEVFKGGHMLNWQLAEKFLTKHL